MATHSNIGVENDDGTFDFIYHHWDGYPGYLGRMLLDHYNSEAAARAIVGLGDLSLLCERLTPSEGSNHSFDNPEEGVTRAYGRDRGETGIEFRTTEGASPREILQQEHAYVWRRDKNCWWYVNLDIPLTNCFEQSDDD